jgi:hypothetical protein
MTPTELKIRIANAFAHVYPEQADHTDGILVNLNDDETIDVELEGITTWRAEPASDNDDYLYFYPYDPDYAEEFPDENPRDYLCLRVKALS